MSKKKKKLMSGKDYVRKNGLVCPVCRGKSVHSLDTSSDPGEIIQHMECTGCRAYWHETYYLSGYDYELEEQENEV